MAEQRAELAASQDALVFSEDELVALCGRLGAAQVHPVSEQERALPRATAISQVQIEQAIGGIRVGGDPLGDAFCRLRSAERRRKCGATYTPSAIVHSMIEWAAKQGRPGRVIDPGAGSGRFLRRAAQVFPGARLVGIELDPLAAWTARATLAAEGLANRAEIHLADYRGYQLEPGEGTTTLFVGNPPYVRHHLIDRRWKRWLRETAAGRDLWASQLAGLHVHFFLATCELARPGDIGAYVTSSEWLDVNYGRLVRELLVGPLGIERMDVLDPNVAAFADAQTTAVITGFRIGNRSASVQVRKVGNLTDLALLAGGRSVPRARLAACSRWSSIGGIRSPSCDLIELGELCRVHRGQVTGANAVWIAGSETPKIPCRLLYDTVTRARELLDSPGVLRPGDALRSVIDLPGDLEELAPDDRDRVEAFLAWARERGADQSYIARHRRPWWSVRLREPAPILATYMARRPPAFVRNLAGARHLNIAHGIYPRQAMSADCLDALCRYLNGSVSTADGRTYAGGLTKFEPREMERLWVPRPETLAELGAA